MVHSEGPESCRRIPLARQRRHVGLRMSATAVAGRSAEIRWLTRRRLGYLVWAAALAFFFVPEILAMSKTIDRRLPFTTLSGMVGHLEYRSSSFEIVTTLVVICLLVSIVRLPPGKTAGVRRTVRDQNKPRRTAGGRLTFTSEPDLAESRTDFDASIAFVWLLATIVTVALFIALATLAAREWWPDPPPKPGETNALFHAGYVLYGLIALVCFVIPSVFAFVAGRDAPFPTLPRTLSNLETLLQGFGRFGGAVAWFLSYLLIWGLVFLLLHLTLYPFPNITHLLHPTGQ